MPRPEVRAVVLVWRDPGMVVGSGTFAGDVAGRLGLRNVCADHPDRYPHVSQPGGSRRPSAGYRRSARRALPVPRMRRPGDVPGPPPAARTGAAGDCGGTAWRRRAMYCPPRCESAVRAGRDRFCSCRQLVMRFAHLPCPTHRKHRHPQIGARPKRTAQNDRDHRNLEQRATPSAG